MEGFNDPVVSILIAVLSLIGASLGAWATWYGHKNRQEIDQLKYSHELSAGRQSRYTQSARDLSSDSLAVRQAAVYTLRNVADEWQKEGNLDERDAAVNLLCAYLRDHPDMNKARDDGTPHDEGVRRAIVTIISDHNGTGAEMPWPEKLTDLKGAFLEKTKMRNSSIRRLDLREANLRGADFKEADLSGSDLRNANLVYAYLKLANMRDVDLRGADLVNADLSEADLTGANVSGVDLSSTNLSGTRGLS